MTETEFDAPDETMARSALNMAWADVTPETLAGER